jgi:ubiquinone/menaquinone biosynthesis C-methylase UbiE
MGLAGDGAGLRLLDVGCGTGASTAALLAAYPAAEIVAVDGSAGMVERARGKRWPASVRFEHSRLEDLAGSGVTGPFDGILAAYLVRNLPDADGGLVALRELLAPGAPLVVHDYSVADSRRARLVWDAVCWTVIVPAGRVVTGDGELYRYLWRSVRGFDGAAGFRDRLARAGLTDVRSASVPGWQRGVVHTFRGYRPLNG